MGNKTTNSDDPEAPPWRIPGVMKTGSIPPTRARLESLESNFKDRLNPDWLPGPSPNTASKLRTDGVFDEGVIAALAYSSRHHHYLYLGYIVLPGARIISKQSRQMQNQRICEMACECDLYSQKVTNKKEYKKSFLCCLDVFGPLLAPIPLWSGGV